MTPNGIAPFITTADTHGVRIARAVRATARLRRLAAALKENRKTRRIHFNMRTWGSHTGEHEPAEQNYCGTSACILGFAALMPENQAEGLQARWYKQTTISGATRQALTISLNVMEDEAVSDDSAGAEFFGLTQNEAFRLFRNMKIKATGAIELLKALADDREELRELRALGIDYV